MTTRGRSLVALGCALALTAGAEQAPREGGSETTDARPQATTTGPDTTGVALWARLERADYRHRWATWPGKGTHYAGQEPHGMLLTTYLNPAALDALTSRAGAMPAGAIIVKENYMPDSTFAAATVMFKVTNYDPANNDWFWLKRNADGTIEAQGRVPMCQGCHAAQRENDYLFTGRIR